MDKNKTIEEIREKIHHKGLNKISDYFDLSEDKLNMMDADTLKHLFNMARIGMQLEKEVNLSHRASEMSHVRVAKMVCETKDEMRQYIKRTLPHRV